ncbi:MAG: hypothetical protein JO250_17125 [Armatimonadetes bacterium]|nr:hypothetical protein [Armatimonadota bacterium]
MMLEQVHPAPDLARLIRDYEGRGGVLMFAFFSDDFPRLPEPELHREAAIATLQAFAERNERYFAQEAVVQAFINAGLDPETHFRVTTQPEKAQGREITIAEFVGPLYEVGSHRLLLRGRTRNHLNHYFFAGEPESPGTVREIPGGMTGYGYAYAFTEPPYNLRGTSEEINTLFLSMNVQLFQDFEEAVTFYEWSTDWSTYFDAGHEWWGAFLWTVHNTKTNLILGIGASTTD